MVLHLECVALHPAGDHQPGQDLVRERAYIEEGAGRIDQLRKLALNDAPVDVFDGERRADDAGKRMQNDEAVAVGDEGGKRLAVRGLCE